MSKEHVATSHPFTKAIIETVVRYVREFKPMDRDDNDVLYDLWTQMQDGLQIPISVTIAEWELLGKVKVGNDE